MVVKFGLSRYLIWLYRDYLQRFFSRILQLCQRKIWVHRVFLGCQPLIILTSGRWRAPTCKTKPPLFNFNFLKFLSAHPERGQSIATPCHKLSGQNATGQDVSRSILLETALLRLRHNQIIGSVYIFYHSRDSDFSEMTIYTSSPAPPSGPLN